MSQENEYIENDILEEEELEEEAEQSEEEEGSEDSTDYEALYLAEKDRRMKAEKAIIKKKESDKKSLPVKNNTKQLTEQAIERTVLKAQGTSETELELLEKIALVNDISLIEAKNDPIFKALKEQATREEEQLKAGLPASRGGKSKILSMDRIKDKVMADDDLSDEELDLMIKSYKR